MSDQATDAREACEEAIRRAINETSYDDDGDPMTEEQEAEHVFQTLFAPSRVPCPTNCVGGLVRAFADSDQPSRMGGGGATIKCPDCSDGTVEGPSLAEQVLGLEEVQAVRIDDAGVEVWALPAEPLLRRRSSESAPTGGTT